MEYLGVRALAKLLLAGATIFCVVRVSTAGVLRVPEEWPQLQATLYAAETGDTVLVSPGVYSGNFLWPNRSGIALLSEEGAAATILDGRRTETVLGLYFAAIDSTTLIRGFTFTNGKVEGT